MVDTADTIINLINLRRGKDFGFRFLVGLPYRIVDTWVNTRKHTGVTLSQVAKTLGPMQTFIFKQDYFRRKQA